MSNLPSQTDRILRTLSPMLLAMIMASLPFAATQAQMRDSFAAGSALQAPAVTAEAGRPGAPV